MIFLRFSSSSLSVVWDFILKRCLNAVLYYTWFLHCEKINHTAGTCWLGLTYYCCIYKIFNLQNSLNHNNDFFFNSLLLLIVSALTSGTISRNTCKGNQYHSDTLEIFTFSLIVTAYITMATKMTSFWDKWYHKIAVSSSL